MGCASSKQQKRCRHCQNRPYDTTPVTRSYSMHVHHPPQSENDSYHLVALTSTTLGSLERSPEPEEEKKTVGLVEARTWSAMIDRKIPKIAPRTPLQTPPGEPETINAWELMEGLDDVSTPLFRSPIHVRSFSFDVVREKLPDSPPKKKAAAAETTVVLYFTSLRGVRKTYEDCCHVREALRAHGVRVDERDVSMHSGFRDELRRLAGGGTLLPRVFVAGRCVGGADEIRRLNEDGQLGKLLDGCERVGSGGDEACEACGDVRFVPCDTCSGSCKVYCEEQEEEERDDNDDYGFQRCPDCNENGLIRCPICCS